MRALTSCNYPPTNSTDPQLLEESAVGEENLRKREEAVQQSEARTHSSVFLQSQKYTHTYSHMCIYTHTNTHTHTHTHMQTHTHTHTQEELKVKNERIEQFSQMFDTDQH